MNVRRARVAALLLSSAALTGCDGTMYSRGQGPYAVGKYPFHAFATDIWFMSQVSGPGKAEIGMEGTGSTIFFWGLVSLPFDTVLDTVLLPVDLVAWAFGASKTWDEPVAPLPQIPKR